MKAFRKARSQGATTTEAPLRFNAAKGARLGSWATEEVKQGMARMETREIDTHAMLLQEQAAHTKRSSDIVTITPSLSTSFDEDSDSPGKVTPQKRVSFSDPLEDSQEVVSINQGEDKNFTKPSFDKVKEGNVNAASIVAAAQQVRADEERRKSLENSYGVKSVSPETRMSAVGRHSFTGGEKRLSIAEAEDTALKAELDVRKRSVTNSSTLEPFSNSESRPSFTSPVKEGTSEEGTSKEGTSEEGTSKEGTSKEGTSEEGTSKEGTSEEGTSKEVLKKSRGSIYVAPPSARLRSDSLSTEESGDGEEQAIFANPGELGEGENAPSLVSLGDSGSSEAESEQASLFSTEGGTGNASPASSGTKVSKLFASPGAPPLPVGPPRASVYTTGYHQGDNDGGEEGKSLRGSLSDMISRRASAPYQSPPPPPPPAVLNSESSNPSNTSSSARRRSVTALSSNNISSSSGSSSGSSRIDHHSSVHAGGTPSSFESYEAFHVEGKRNIHETIKRHLETELEQTTFSIRGDLQQMSRNMVSSSKLVMGEHSKLVTEQLAEVVDAVDMRIKVAFDCYDEVARENSAEIKTLHDKVEVLTKGIANSKREYDFHLERLMKDFSERLEKEREHFDLATQARQQQVQDSFSDLQRAVMKMRESDRKEVFDLVKEAHDTSQRVLMDHHDQVGGMHKQFDNKLSNLHTELQAKHEEHQESVMEGLQNAVVKSEEKTIVVMQQQKDMLQQLTEFMQRQEEERVKDKEEVMRMASVTNELAISLQKQAQDNLLYVQEEVVDLRKRLLVQETANYDIKREYSKLLQKQSMQRMPSGIASPTSPDTAYSTPGADGPGGYEQGLPAGISPNHTYQHGGNTTLGLSPSGLHDYASLKFGSTPPLRSAGGVSGLQEAKEPAPAPPSEGVKAQAMQPFLSSNTKYSGLKPKSAQKASSHSQIKADKQVGGGMSSNSPYILNDDPYGTKVRGSLHVRMDTRKR